MSKAKKQKLKRLKENINEYRRVITVGCGDWRCTNPYCKSNEKNEGKYNSDSDASKLAIKMFKEKIKSCVSYTRKAITPLKYDHIRSLLEHKTNIIEDDEQKNDTLESESDSCAELVIIIQQAFTHLDIFNESFMTNNVCNVSIYHMCKDIIYLINNHRYQAYQMQK